MVVVFGGPLLIALSRLRPHEETERANLSKIRESILRAGAFYGPPILVEAHRLIILDGHHRVAALRSLDCALVPAVLVEYSSVEVRHCSDIRRRFSKSCIIARALSGKPFPPKTTRHIYPAPAPVAYSLSFLRTDRGGEEK